MVETHENSVINRSYTFFQSSIKEIAKTLVLRKFKLNLIQIDTKNF